MTGATPPQVGAERLLGRAAAELLGLPRLPGPPPPGPDDDGWAALHQAAVVGRTTGLLSAAAAAGALPANEAHRHRAARDHREAMAVALVLERLLLDARRRLVTGAGIEPLVLKGPAVAHLDYPRPSWRDFGDIDLLVPATQVDDAVAVLLRTGAERPMPEVRAGWDRRFGKSITLLDRTGYEVDLHRTIAPGVFGLRVDPRLLFGGTRTFTVGGQRFHALGDDARLVHACLHAAAGNREARLSTVLDVAVMAHAAAREGRIGPDAGTGPGTFNGLVEAFGCAAAVERAAELVRVRMGLDPRPLGLGLTVPDEDRVHLDRYLGGFAGPALLAWTALGWRDRPAYVLALAWPSPENLEARELDRRRHLARLVLQLRGRG